ncbi:hypothetical protein ACP4OV_018341 [Aristida adscensionis]
MEEDSVAVRTSDLEMSDIRRLLVQSVSSFIPDAPLSLATAAGAPDIVDRISDLPADVVSRLPAKDAARTASTMEELLAALTPDPAMSDNAQLLAQHVYSAIQAPPVYPDAPLSLAAATWVPDGVDRISDLPAALLADVVSRLPVKDAARTAVLSRCWRGVWRSVPPALVDLHLLSVGGSHLPLHALASSVSRALASHPGPFRCVYLTAVPMDAHRAEVDGWLQLLAAKGVEDLVFANRATAIDGYLQIPAALFSCTRLTRLSLGFLRFPDAATLSSASAFLNLRELALCSVAMDDRDLAFLLDKCPVLEKLLLVSTPSPVGFVVRSHTLRCVQVCSTFVDAIDVHEASGLERLLLWEAWGVGLSKMCSIIRLDYAPNLRCLGFLVPGMHQLEIHNTIIKVGTEPGPETTVPSVELLAIRLKLGVEEEATMVPCFLRCFPKLETLYVQSENDSEPPLGPQYGTMNNGKLDDRFWSEGVGLIDCVKGSIKKVVFRGFQGKNSEIQFIKFIAKHAAVLEYMVVETTNECSDEAIGHLSTLLDSGIWATPNCRVKVVRTPLKHEGTPWCFTRASHLSMKDPFDFWKCLLGECLCP